MALPADVANLDTNALPGVDFDMVFAGVPSATFHIGVQINQQQSPYPQKHPRKQRATHLRHVLGSCHLPKHSQALPVLPFTKVCI
jgi:hypothetical protein